MSCERVLFVFVNNCKHLYNIVVLRDTLQVLSKYSLIFEYLSGLNYSCFGDLIHSASILPHYNFMFFV